MADFPRFSELYDGKLTTEDGSTFNIYKIALAKKSKYFRKMFRWSFLEGQAEFDVPELRGDILGAVLSFIYSGEIEINDSNIQDLLMAAHFLRLEDLVSEINKVSLTVTNCIPVLSAALKIEHQNLKKKSLRYLMICFEHVAERDCTALSQLPYDQCLKELLGNRSLCVRDEAVTWAVVRAWIEADIENRRCLLPNLLLEFASFDPCPGKFLDAFSKDHGEASPMTDEKSAGDGSLRDVALGKIGLEKGSQMPSFVRASNLPSMSTKRRPAFLYLIAHRTEEFQLNGKMRVYITYDDGLDYWRELFDVDGWPDDLLASGRSAYARTDDKLMRYDLVGKQLEQLPKPGTYRKNFAVAAVDGVLYVIGGACPRPSRPSVATYKVEAYSHGEGWKEVSPMFPLCRPRAVAAGGKIYVVGKALGDTSAMAAQSYSPETDQWSMLPPPAVFRTAFRLAEYRGKLYVLGGEDKSGDNLNDVEILDPEQKIWVRGSNLPGEYPISSATVLNGKLIFQPDHDAFESLSDPFWAYDEQWGSWTRMDRSSPLGDIRDYRFVQVVEEECVRLATEENRAHATAFKLSPFGFESHKRHRFTLSVRR